MSRRTSHTGGPTTQLLSKAAAALVQNGGVVSVGIDLVDTAEVTQLIAAGGQTFLDDTWTAAEQRDVNRDPRRLAGRWAVKEATMKALRTGLGDLTPLDVEIRTRQSGALNVRLHGRALKAAETMQIFGWRASLTYDGQWAIGLAVALGARSATHIPRGSALSRDRENECFQEVNNI